MVPTRSAGAAEPIGRHPEEALRGLDADLRDLDDRAQFDVHVRVDERLEAESRALRAFVVVQRRRSFSGLRTASMRTMRPASTTNESAAR